ncbi:MAG: ABC transporter permease subunit [Spirochaetes bacterium]|nr:ABC transporter permease subunit [Spirochaetota bacterium]
MSSQIIESVNSKLKNPLTIMKKELMSYYTTPIAYIVISVFLVVTGWFFFSTFFLFNQAELREFFKLLPFVFSFVIPAVTMRLFSEEKNTGSFEILMTLPLSLGDVVTGKLLAGIVFIISMLLPTIAYVISMIIVGSPDLGPVFGGYFGAILLGGAYASIGIFSSSLTRNQIISFIIGLVLCLILTLVDKFLFFLPSSALGFAQYLSADYHFKNFTRGIIDSRDIIYFLSVMAIGIIGTVQILEERR